LPEARSAPSAGFLAANAGTSSEDNRRSPVALFRRLVLFIRLVLVTFRNSVEQSASSHLRSADGFGIVTITCGYVALETSAIGGSADSHSAAVAQGNIKAIFQFLAFRAFNDLPHRFRRQGTLGFLVALERIAERAVKLDR
jgi:hypothetical protein